MRYNAPPNWLRKYQNVVRLRYGSCVLPCDYHGAPCVSCIREKLYLQWETTKVLCILQCRTSRSRHVFSGQPSLLSTKTPSVGNEKFSIV